MVSKTFKRALLHREKVKETIFHLSTLQKSHQIIQAIIHQILLKKVGDKPKC